MMKKYTHVLAALDEGITRRTVAERAFSIARSNGANLLFAHVIDAAVMEMGVVDAAPLFQEAESRLREDLADIIAMAEVNERISSFDVEIRLGRPADGLLNHVAKEFEPDLVVCGDRGFSGLKYAFLGSVSAALVRNLKCDVLVVKNSQE